MVNSLLLVQITPESAKAQEAILNSDPFFNRISAEKEILTVEQIMTEHQEAEEIGADRFLIMDRERNVGILEYLPNNPGDGHTWLGLLQIDKQYQGKGYGSKALQTFYELLKAKGIAELRLGVIAANEPAHRFWQKQGYRFVKSSRNQHHKEVIVYDIKLE